MQLSEFQEMIERIYLEKDRARGLDGTFRWFVEELGELARAIRVGQPSRLSEEVADCLAWLSTIASICGVSIEQAVGKYASGCPKCRGTPCACN